MRRALLGKDTPSAAYGVLNVGTSLKHLRRYKEAQEKYLYAMELAKAGGNDRLVATVLNNLGALRKTLNDARGAENFDRQALELRRRLFGNEHLDVAQSLNNLAVSLSQQKKYDQAEELLRECLKIQTAIVGPKNKLVGMTLRNLADNLLNQDADDAEALDLITESYALLREVAPPGETWRTKAALTLSKLLLTRGRTPDAEAPLMECAAHLDQMELADRRSAMAHLIEFYKATGDEVQAQIWKTKSQTLSRE